MERSNKADIKKHNNNRRYVRLTTVQKQQLLAESELPGNSIAQVASKYGVSVSTVFDWRNKMKKGALIGLSTKEELVPASKVKALQR
jgi:transposase